jgi:iron complex transport system ATP-binding protein
MNANTQEPTTILDICQLSLQQSDRTLCQALNLTIHQGDAWVILGQNGCGKSTLLSSLAGWHFPHAGHVLLHNKSLKQWPSRERAQHMAWLCQQDDNPFPSTVLEKVLTGCHSRLKRWQWESQQDHQHAESLLASLDLAGFAARDLSTLSGGERRRVSLATVLMQQTPLLLLDEPLSQLDIHHQQQTLTLLSAERLLGKTIVMVSHDPNHAVRFASHVLLMFGNGRWIAGHKTDVLTTQHLSALYDHPMREITQDTHRWFVPA